MHLVRIDPTSWTITDPNYGVAPVFEAYSSLIWTERFGAAGDVKITSPDKYSLRTAFPEGSLCSLMDSSQVMRIETCTDDVDENGNEVLVATGRSLPESVMDSRLFLTWDVLGGGLARQTLKSLTPAQVASGFLAKSIADTIYSANGSYGTLSRYEYYAFHPQDLVPKLAISDSTTDTEAAIIWAMEAAPSMDILQNFLTTGNLGMRSIRPPQGIPWLAFRKNVVDVDSAGNVSRSNVPVGQRLLIDVYNGTDRSNTVIFDTTNGHVKKPSYLYTKKDYVDVVYVLPQGNNGALGVSWPDTFPGGVLPNSGIEARIASIQGPQQGNLSNADWAILAKQAAKAEYNKRRKLVYFDGELTPNAPYTYGTDYYLGDIVSLRGNDSISSTYQVTEYVRSKDANGESGYPTLVAFN